MGASRVTIGDALATEVIAWSDSQVVVRVPRTAALGAQTVRLVTPYGQTQATVRVVRAVSLAAGYNHSLALRPDGTVVGWGYNYFGQANPLSGVLVP